MTLQQDLEYAGRRVLITGVANGFGTAMSLAFKAVGAAVIMADIDEAPPLARGSGATRRRLRTCDQAQPASIARLVQAVGPVDVLVNNAGMLGETVVGNQR
jgi:NAD(P)-dependent dehydrogenase (short-subunit alcohol dehydrogenase family)